MDFLKISVQVHANLKSKNFKLHLAVKNLFLFFQEKKKDTVMHPTDHWRK